jgi:hypothetical protein
MNSPYYTQDQHWLEPELEALRISMRNVIRHQRAARNRATKAKKLVRNKFSYSVVGRKMVKRITDIRKSL